MEKIIYTTWVVLVKMCHRGLKINLEWQKKNVCTVQMVHDGFWKNRQSCSKDENRVKELNLEAKRFFLYVICIEESVI